MTTMATTTTKAAMTTTTATTATMMAAAATLVASFERKFFYSFANEMHLVLETKLSDSVKMLLELMQDRSRRLPD